MRATDVIEHIKAQYKPEEEICLVVWSREDIKSIQEDNEGVMLTEEQCDSVLSSMEERHDASYGIDWDTLDFFIDEELGYES